MKNTWQFTLSKMYIMQCLPALYKSLLLLVIPLVVLAKRILNDIVCCGSYPESLWVFFSLDMKFCGTLFILLTLSADEALGATPSK